MYKISIENYKLVILTALVVLNEPISLRHFKVQ